MSTFVDGRVQVTAAITQTALVSLAFGVLLGLAAAWSLGRLLTGFLYGVAPTDGLTLGVATAVLALPGAFAAAVPAYRASGINPTEVLSAE